MAASRHLSVQAIRGRFEKSRNDPIYPSNSSPSFNKRGRSPLDAAEHGTHNDSPLLLSQEELDGEKSRDRVTNSPVMESRLRSFSVGNLRPSFQQNENMSKNTLTRNHSYGLNNYNSENTDCNSNSQRSPSDNFNSFSEKQKLVESIVMNIKKSAANSKSKEMEHKNKEGRAKELFNITSKFEKDLKNVLERGVRRKWNTKGTKEEKILKETNFENHKNRLPKAKKLDRQIVPEHKNSFSKISSVLGVDMFPVNSRVYDEPPVNSRVYDQPDHKHYIQCQRNDSDNIGKPPVPTISNNITKLKRELISSKQNVESSHYDNVGSCTYTYPAERSCDPTLRESTNNGIENAEISSPVRPPRRRRIKKDKAPMPPSPIDVGFVAQPQRQDRDRLVRENDIHTAPTSEHFNTSLVIQPQELCDRDGLVKENDIQTAPTNEHFNTSDESSYYSMNFGGRRRSSGEISKDLTYEEHCERYLERERVYKNRDNTDEAYSDGSSSSNKENEELSSRNIMSKSETELDRPTYTSLPPTANPPKKPPRTFAYDIYLSLKSESKDKDSPSLSSSVPKLTGAELESMYTKPIKRLKNKPTSPGFLPPLRRNTDVSSGKPAVAPKPIDIIAKAKKRLSVTEPLPSNAVSKEHTPSVKRNSSFRFSFRKHKKNSVTSPKAIKKETQVGRRLRLATKNLHPKKQDNEKRVRFQTDDEDIVYDDTTNDGGPIYATPYSSKDIPKDKNELHYMCSPLFQNGVRVPFSGNRDDSPGLSNPDDTPELPQTSPPTSDENKERLGIMEELRQSYRLVQKRLKGVTQKDIR